MHTILVLLAVHSISERRSSRGPKWTAGRQFRCGRLDLLLAASLSALSRFAAFLSAYLQTYGQMFHPAGWLSICTRLDVYMGLAGNLGW